jgi:nicotinamide-nucleotide amidase
VTARAGIVITGTEVLTGRVADANGPFLADRLLELGVELAHIAICGDRQDDIGAALRFLAAEKVDLIITSGGLGPTADDMTVEVVARFCGRELTLDAELEEKIAAILRSFMRRHPGADFDAVRAANRKQALVPDGAAVIDPVGTAPGLIVPGSPTDSLPTPTEPDARARPLRASPSLPTPTVLVLPGPPRELQPMWHTAIGMPELLAAVGGRTVYRQETVRMFGLPESGLAETLRQAQRDIPDFDRLEITTCLRRGELEIVTRYEPGDAAVYRQLVDTLCRAHPREVFSTDGTTIDDQVATLLDGRRIATAESCTAGLLSARLTDRAGSSAYVMGGAVVYSNEAKTELLQVDPALIAEHGAVSEPVAEAMAAGALRRFGADVAVAITGIAGPGGGTPDKPVGTVCFTVAATDGALLTQTLLLPGNRNDIRERSTTVAMHLLRRLLRDSSPG